MLLYIYMYFFLHIHVFNVPRSKTWEHSPKQGVVPSGLRKQRQLAFAMFYQPHGSEVKEIGSWEEKYHPGSYLGHIWMFGVKYYTPKFNIAPET